MINEECQGRGIYIHIPFCLAKCHYCDFYSVPLSVNDWLEDYTWGLAAEIKQRASFYDGQPIETIYFGGGTPSLLSPEQISRVLNQIYRNFPVLKGAEITMEANPLTVNRSSLQNYLRAGVNRLSLGVQSFNDQELQMLGRLHKASHSQEAIVAAREAGFQNINLDLIYGFPGQTIDNWLSSLSTALKAGPEHLSLYLLQLEPDTLLGRKIEKKELELLDEELELAMYELGRQALKNAGYEHYEISNFARPGWECRHNLLYWNSCEYIGVGAGAVSFINHVRHKNTNQLKQYLEAAAFGRDLFWQGEVLEKMDKRQRWIDAVLLGLRTRRGLSLDAFQRRFGIDLLHEYETLITSLIEGGFMEIAAGHLRLTPSAYFVSNQVLCRFMG